MRKFRPESTKDEFSIPTTNVKVNPLNQNKEFNNTEISMITVNHDQETNGKEPLGSVNADMDQNPEITSPDSLLISCNGSINKVRYTKQRPKVDIRFQVLFNKVFVSFF